MLDSHLGQIHFHIHGSGHCAPANSEVSTTAVNDDDNIICPLSYYGLLTVEGPDSAKFLQGQLTCHLNEVTDAQSVEGGYCTPKGRLVSNFRLVQTAENTYALRMRHSILDSTAKVLSKYIVFSKAELAVTSDDYLLVGVFGSKAAAAIADCFGNCPQQANGVVHAEQGLVLQIDEAGLQYECWLKAAAIDSLWPRLTAHLSPRSSYHWELLAIRRGLGDICEPTLEQFLPQMVNYPQTGVISFTKGCYTGQEVVARLHYKSQTKRPMYRLLLKGQNLTPGQALHPKPGKQSVGYIVNAVNVDSQHSEVLASLASRMLGSPLYLDSEDNALVEQLPLPYAITNDD